MNLGRLNVLGGEIAVNNGVVPGTIIFISLCGNGNVELVFNFASLEYSVFVAMKSPIC